ncbi:hypothetical protein CGRA01v4_02553 [Colletotrichum graminicola]|nr:hypothetical protein CGRA01v4_02553 [Colletotrichum graminicola]
MNAFFFIARHPQFIYRVSGTIDEVSLQTRSVEIPWSSLGGAAGGTSGPRERESTPFAISFLPPSLPIVSSPYYVCTTCATYASPMPPRPQKPLSLRSLWICDIAAARSNRVLHLNRSSCSYPSSSSLLLSLSLRISSGVRGQGRAGPRPGGTSGCARTSWSGRQPFRGSLCCFCEQPFAKQGFITSFLSHAALPRLPAPRPRPWLCLSPSYLRSASPLFPEPGKQGGINHWSTVKPGHHTGQGQGRPLKDMVDGSGWRGKRISFRSTSPPPHLSG